MNWNATNGRIETINWNNLVQQVHSREDLVSFLQAMLCHLREKPEEWENQDLASFLEAAAAWMEDMDGYYKNRGESVPEQPTWKTLAEVMLAARVYE